MNFDWFIPACLQSVKSSANIGQICSILPRTISQEMLPTLRPLPGNPCPLLNLFFVSPPPLHFHGLPLAIHFDPKHLVLALFSGPCIPKPIVVALPEIPFSLYRLVVSELTSGFRV